LATKEELLGWLIQARTLMNKHGYRHASTPGNGISPAAALMLTVSGKVERDANLLKCYHGDHTHSDAFNALSADHGKAVARRKAAETSYKWLTGKPLKLKDADALTLAIATLRNK
jgi:hypothetical protein